MDKQLSCEFYVKIIHQSVLFLLFSVRELHREFALSGCDVLQPLTFYASTKNMKSRGIDLTVCLHLTNFINCWNAFQNSFKFILTMPNLQYAV